MAEPLLRQKKIVGVLKTPAELNVDLPKDNLTINAVALRLMEKLTKVFSTEGNNVDIMEELRKKLKTVVRSPEDRFKLEAPRDHLDGVPEVRRDGAALPPHLITPPVISVRSVGH